MLNRLLRRRISVGEAPFLPAPALVADPLAGLPIFGSRDETVGRAFKASRLHTAHKTILTAALAAPSFQHEREPAPAQEIILFRSNFMPELGLLVSPRPISLYNGTFESPLVPIMVLDRPQPGRIALRSPMRPAHLCALDPGHNPVGETDLLRDWIGPWELFTLERNLTPALRPDVEAALSELGRMMERNLHPSEIIAWIASGRETGNLVAPALIHFMSRANGPAPAAGPVDEAARQAQARVRRIAICHPCSGPLDPLLKLQPGSGGDLQRHLRGTWDFLPDGRVLACGSRVAIDVDLPCRPAYGRLRLELKASPHPALMTVAVNGWQIGVSALNPPKLHGTRLDFWMPQEALDSPTASVTLDFDPPAALHNGIPYAFELTACEIGIGPGVEQPELPDSNAALMGSFESLGYDCEFGFVQRHFGIDPVGILRFAGFGTFRHFIDALANDFEGLGTPGSLVARIHVATVYRGAEPPLVIPEFFMGDGKLGLSFHTWKGPDDSSEEDARKNHEIKLAYMRRKFLEDLEDADKIWLYKQTHHEDVNEIHAIYDLLGRHGPNKLFCVSRATPERPAGSIEWMGPRLLRGYSGQPHFDAQIFEPEAWLELCQKAFRAFARRQATIRVGPGNSG